jgi:hypothetical protein
VVSLDYSVKDKKYECRCILFSSIHEITPTKIMICVTCNRAMLPQAVRKVVAVCVVRRRISVLLCTVLENIT